jgi:glutamine synthetase
MFYRFVSGRGNIMAHTFESIQKLIKEQDIFSIDLKFIDMNGDLRKVTISRSEFNPGLMSEGIGFDGSSVTGFRKVAAGDLVLIPDLDTLSEEPFSEEKIFSFMCNIKEADTREQFPDDPRYIARKASDFMKQSGIADEAGFAPEYEFYLFSEVAFDIKSNHSFFNVDTEEGYWNNEFDYENSYLSIDQNKGYHRALPADRYFEVRQSITRCMAKLGIDFRYHHHEVGGPSQHEIEVPLTPVFRAAENAVMIKYIIKNIAREHNLYASFMPKPLSNDPGSGLHCHIQLRKGGKNLFYEKGKYGNLSKEALYFIGGVLHHGCALAALTNPSVNSFKRLVPGFEAPTNLFFSVGNRSAAIRIPKYATSEDDVRMEFRTPDATCNPYFALAATLMAGLDGIRNKISPTEQGYGPFDMNIHELPQRELKKIRSIPESFRDSLTALEKDHAFLLEGNVFTRNFVEAWIATKHKEIDAFRHSIDPLEYQLYFDC